MEWLIRPFARKSPLVGAKSKRRPVSSNTTARGDRERSPSRERAVTAQTRLAAASSKLFRRSVYFWACLLYAVYNSAFLQVDYCSLLYPDVLVLTPVEEYYYAPVDPPVVNDTAPGTRLLAAAARELAGNVTYQLVQKPAARCSFDGWSPINQAYVGWGWVQVLNSLMFAASWRKAGPGGSVWWKNILLNPLAAPDLVFVLSSTIWACTATLYPYGTYKVDRPLRQAETAASGLDLIASFGWFWSWWATLEQRPGRGLTFDDPDFVGLLTLIIAASMYLTYNLQILADPALYDTSYIYVWGDITYFVAGLCYLLAALRDGGMFWWMPFAGGWTYSVTDISSGVVYSPNGDVADGGAASPGGFQRGKARGGMLSSAPPPTTGILVNPLVAARGAEPAPLFVDEEAPKVEEAAVVVAEEGRPAAVLLLHAPRSPTLKQRASAPAIVVDEAQAVVAVDAVVVTPAASRTSVKNLVLQRKMAVLMQRLYRGRVARRLTAGWTRVVAADGDVYWYNKGRAQSSWYAPGNEPPEA
jgi:hypothetical protein